MFCFQICRLQRSVESIKEVRNFMLCFNPIDAMRAVKILTYPDRVLITLFMDKVHWESRMLTCEGHIGKSALHWAVEAGNVPAALQLLRAGADLNTPIRWESNAK